jgi:hypothetical protein
LFHTGGADPVFGWMLLDVLVHLVTPHFELQVP